MSVMGVQHSSDSSNDDAFVGQLTAGNQHLANLECPTFYNVSIWIRLDGVIFNWRNGGDFKATRVPAGAALLFDFFLVVLLYTVLYVVPATALCVCTAAYPLCVDNAGVVFRGLASV
jgi:hypothetical protein